jgi:hypothetical protein
MVTFLYKYTHANFAVFVDYRVEIPSEVPNLKNCKRRVECLQNTELRHGKSSETTLAPKTILFGPATLCILFIILK